jgi:HD-GYP domain-containing protein (c-di-GMP phosphodiesterase class II)
MHDVGKIWTPDGVLQKPGPLTETETRIMREHSQRGGEMTSRVRALEGVSASVRAHHERWDGSGYPDGLAGEEIPLAARIVSVADTYDAMTSTRPYRKALSHEVAVLELHRVRGTQLDPQCVDAFMAAFGAHDQRPAA